MSGKVVNIGIIGLGRMGRNHLRVLSTLKDVEVGFIYDLDLVAARALAAEFGTRAVEDAATGLAGVDAVVIASPTVTHAHYVRMAAEAGRSILVEKPLSDDLPTSEALGELVQGLAGHLQVGFIERFNPAVVQLKQLLDHSAHVVSVDFTRTNRISSRITDVDVIVDLMIHDVDLALFINGPAVRVDAHGSGTAGMVDFASAMLRHENGRLSRIHASRITHKKVRQITATATDMFIDCDLLRKELTLSRDSEIVQTAGQPYRITATEERIEVRPQEALLSELQTFLRDVRNRERSDEAPGAQEAIAAMAVCETIRSAILSA